MVLSDRQKLFAKYYVISLNASEAAIKAGYSHKCANRTGSRLLQKPEIQEAIQKEIKKRNDRIEVTQDQVVKELARVAFGNPRKVMEWGPRGVILKPSEDLSSDEVALVSEVSETITKDGGSLKLKTHDKIRALELLGKHLGMFVEKSKLDIDGALEININYGDDNEGDG